MHFFLCFERVDTEWYHLLPTPLEFERMVNHLVMLVLISTQTKSNCAPDRSVMLANSFLE